MSKRKSKPKDKALIIIECPSELSDAARREWDWIIPELTAAGRLTAVDRPALAVLCEAIAAWNTATKAIAEFGAVLKSPSGFPVQSPYVSIAAKHADTIIRLSNEFGLTPAARRRLPSFSSGPSWYDDIPTLDASGLKPLSIDPPDESND
jgi:P27 family predicted phage terminase small subunit